MIRSTRARRAAVALAATALVLTACGSEDDDSDNTADDTESSAPPLPRATASSTSACCFRRPVTSPTSARRSSPASSSPSRRSTRPAACNGKPVKSSRADSGDGTPDIAGASVDSLLGDGVDIIIGAAASGVSLSVIDKITGAGVVQFSPANTRPTFDTYDDKGLYFRTAPSDLLQGQVLANMAVEDGFSNVAIVARQDAYGEGLAEQVVETLEEQGATVAADILYAADAQNFTAEVNELAAAKPDAIVLIAFNETTKIIPQLISKGLGPQDVQLYFVDGNMADYSSEKFDLTGVKGTFPAPAEVDEEFKNKLKSIDKGLKDFTYGPQSYDATMLTALAAIAAGDDSGEAIASEIVNVSKDGETCSTFADCVELLEAGEDINYEGVSGPFDLNDTGSPSAATIGI